MIGNSKIAINFKSVSKAFDGVLALNGVDIELGGCGIFAIIGPNGAGKTTLLDVATAQLIPDTGHVEIAGRVLGRRVKPSLLSNFGIARTFQELRLFRHMSVVENLMVARRPQLGEQLWRALSGFGTGKDETQHRDEAARILRFVGIENLGDSLAGELSYGQQKLVTLAQGLATNSRVLLLDEPVAGVHPQMIEVICNVLQRSAADGKLIVIVEHDIDVVRRIANRVIVMDQGRVIADGVPAEVLARREILEAYVG